MNMSIQQISESPFGDDQVQRAREIIGSSASLNEKLEEYLARTPTRGQMIEFLESLKAAAAEELLKHNIEIICKVAGIEEPSAADRLLAMQIGLLQEQNAILQSGMTRTLNQMRSDAKERTNDTSGLFTAALGGMLIAASLAR